MTHVELVRAAVVASTLLSTGVALPEVSSAGQASTRIVWSQFTDRHFTGSRIVSALSNGKGPAVLSEPGPDVYDLDPAWSPDRTKVAFERDLPDRAQTVIVNADGTNEHVLNVGCVSPCDAVLQPTWTADGTRLAFSLIIGPHDQPGDSATSAVLWTANPDGSDVQRLSPTGIDGLFEDYHARFSPDGSYLVFERVDNVTGNAAVFRMDSDGTDVRQLTPWELNADTADLSQAVTGPTADLVVFETYGHGGTPPDIAGDVATVPATCLTVSACADAIRYVTDNGAGPVTSNNPAWSPDGRSIALVEYVHPASAHEAKYADVFTVDAHGLNRHQVSTTQTWNYRPDW